MQVLHIHESHSVVLTSHRTLAQEQRGLDEMRISRREEKKSHFISDTAEMYTENKKTYLALSATKSLRL